MTKVSTKTGWAETLGATLPQYVPRGVARVGGVAREMFCCFAKLEPVVMIKRSVEQTPALSRGSRSHWSTSKRYLHDNKVITTIRGTIY